jgi:hypothetical protein
MITTLIFHLLATVVCGANLWSADNDTVMRWLIATIVMAINVGMDLAAIAEGKR